LLLVEVEDVLLPAPVAPVPVAAEFMSDVEAVLEVEFMVPEAAPVALLS
jgi:hypothetical protein